MPGVARVTVRDRVTEEAVGGRPIGIVCAAIARLLAQGYPLLLSSPSTRPPPPQLAPAAPDPRDLLAFWLFVSAVVVRRQATTAFSTSPIRPSCVHTLRVSALPPRCPAISTRKRKPVRFSPPLSTPAAVPWHCTRPRRVRTRCPCLSMACPCYGCERARVVRDSAWRIYPAFTQFRSWLSIMTTNLPRPAVTGANHD